MSNTSISVDSTIRSNPFSTRFIRPGVIPFLFEKPQCLESLIDAFRGHHFLGQIVGPHGCGKTTLTHSMEKTLAEDFRSVRHVTIRGPRHVLASQAKRPLANENPIPVRDRLLIVDGFERLPTIHRWLLINHCIKSGSALLITTHRRIKRIPILYELNPTLETLSRVTKQLTPELSIDSDLLEKLFDRTDGNIRESIMMLYDWFEATR